MVEHTAHKRGRRKLTARAPAKLILAGEHAVVHGCPALALAVNRYTYTTAQWCVSKSIHFKLLDLAYASVQSLQGLGSLRQQLKQDYSQFVAGRCSIGEVIKRPFELLQYSVISFLEQLNVSLPEGLEIKVNSTIPIGCGMGSSASAVVSTLHVLAELLNFNWQGREGILRLGREIENLQHGNSSGLDLHLAAFGGCVKFQHGSARTCPIPPYPLYVINTGKPASSTGQCVARSQQQFAKHPTLKQDMTQAVVAMEQAMQQQSRDDFMAAMKTCQAYLVQLGVVPRNIQTLITKLAALGVAAKVCGAGSVQGDRAGIVLLAVPEQCDWHALNARVHDLGYNIQALGIDNVGAAIV